MPNVDGKKTKGKKKRRKKEIDGRLQSQGNVHGVRAQAKKRQPLRKAVQEGVYQKQSMWREISEKCGKWGIKSRMPVEVAEGGDDEQVANPVLPLAAPNRGAAVGICGVPNSEDCRVERRRKDRSASCLITER